MTEYQYGSSDQMPTSWPPEPPMRSDAYDGQAQTIPEGVAQAVPASQPMQAAPTAQPAQSASRYVSQRQIPSQPDTSGIDTPGEIHATGYVPVASVDTTESFAAARSGDTDSMPRMAANPYEGRHSAQADSGARQDRPGQAYSSRPAQRQQPQAQAYQYSGMPRSQTYQPAAAVVSQPALQKSGAGKSFLFGFLGALLACALCIGGFAIANGGIINNQVSTATIGTTDQSVINAVDAGQTLAEAVAAKALPSVVAIYNYQDMSNMYSYGYGSGYGTQGGDSLVAAGMGSGVVISDEGYILTNYHVVEDAAKLTINVDGKERDAEFIGGDSSSDVAVIKVEDTGGLVTADIGDSDSLRIGEWVMTVGAPLGLEQSVATGVVSATNRDTVMDGSSSSSSDPYSQLFGYSYAEPEYVYYPNMIQTDAVINPGNSGGALVDADGKLIGINSMLSSSSGNYAGVGFAIPINYAISIAEDVIAGKEPTHAMLGVSLSQVNSTIAQRYNLSADKGAYIAAITEGTGAADSDLEVGDIITAIDGQAVESVTDVTLEVRSHKVGDTVKVTVNRNGETKDIDVKLTSDENLKSENADNAQDQNQNQQPQDGWGNGRGQGKGNGFSEEDLERLLEMMGM